MKSKLNSGMKHSKTIDTSTIARLLRHEDAHGMGRVFMYAFVNEVVRMKTPFPFDCESAQVLENDGGLRVVDKEDRSIAVEHKRNMLRLTLNDQSTLGPTCIEYKGKARRKAILDWLTACIRYTSLQPELRKELTRYAQYIKRTTISQ